MKIRLLISGLLLMASNLLVPCAVMITNNTNTPVTVQDMRIDTYSNTVQPGQTVQGNKNANEHVDLRITRHGILGKKEIYRLRQIACGQTHGISVKATDVIEQTVDKHLFRITREK
jgi:hypothetical protein